MQAELRSGCKVNLILNILRKREDGFHELETVMQPVPVYDLLHFERRAGGVQFSCSNPALPVDGSNLVVKAAEKFFAVSGVGGGARIHLEKRIPLAAGLGGGSGNAAVTLLGLNEIFGKPLTSAELVPIAASLGSDVPFFLQDKPALALGRGEEVIPLEGFSALKGCHILLIHPGFGVSTPWAYKNLARFPRDLNGESGRARRLVELLANGPIASARADFYNSLEAPVLDKFPVLSLFQEFLRDHGAAVAMMSGSGSTTFGIFESEELTAGAMEAFPSKLGGRAWLNKAPLPA